MSLAGGFHYSFTAAGHGGLKDYLLKAASAGSFFPLIFSVMEDVATDCAQVSPKTITCFRYTDPRGGGDDPPIQGDPIEAARYQFNHALPYFRKNPTFTYYTDTNELNPARGDVGANQWAAAYYLEKLRLATANGLRFVWWNGSAGCPDWPDWDYYAEVVRYSAANGHALGWHEHALDAPEVINPDGTIFPAGTMRAGVKAELVLRYRRAYDLFRERGWGWPYLMISEASPGAYVNGDSVDNRLDIEFYEQALIEDYVRGLPILGAALYNWGGAEARPFSKIMPWLTEHVRTHPTPHIAPPPVLTFHYDVEHVSEAIAPELSAWLDEHSLVYRVTPE
jgi:hypothetical protein